MNIGIQAKVSGSLLSLLPKIEAAATGVVKRSADEVEALVIVEAKGGIKNAISQVEITPLHRKILAAGIAAVVMELGSVEHIIAPKNYPDGVLSWVGSDGVRRFAKYVIHPGTPPRPFMGPVALDFRPVFRLEMVTAINAAIAA